MTEPREIADHADQVTEGVWTWAIANSRIGGSTSSSHLVDTDDGAVMIDPVRLAPEALAELPAPRRVYLTAKCHQRAAWRYRRDFGAEVWAPHGAATADEEPDRRYGDGDALPGGLRAVRTPGPEEAHYCLLLDRGGGVLFCSDLLMGDPDDGLEFVPFEYHDDPAATRRSVEGLLDLPFSTLCLDHGEPFADGHGAIRALLADTA
jgi:hypothetical protein